MRISRVGGVIAAANKNNDKPMLQTGTIPVIRRIVTTYQQAGIFPIVIVTGEDEDEIKSQLAPLGVIFVQNKGESSELISSVKIGLEFLSEKCDRIMFTPVKVPMFTPTTLLTMMEHEEDIVIASYQKHGGHPVLLSQKVLPSILGYRGEDGLRGAMRASDADRIYVDVDDKGVILNVHSSEDLQEQLKTHNAAILHPVLHLKMEMESPFLNERLKLLLFLISNNHSIRTGCACIGLAYSKAWEMINRLEQNLGYRIVERQRGGKGGGGTSLTPEGERFLLAYQEFEEAIHQMTQEEFRKRFIDTKIIR